MSLIEIDSNTSKLLSLIEKYEKLALETKSVRVHYTYNQVVKDLKELVKG